MAQSYESRFNGNREEVVSDARKLGIWEAMRKHGAKDYPKFRQFLVDASGDENIGFSPALTDNAESIIDRFIVAYSKRVARLEADNTRLREENDFLRLKLQEGDGESLARMVAVTEEMDK